MPGKALIDTGSDVSAVSSSILRQLGMPVFHPTSTQGIGGPVPVNLYKVSLHIMDARNVGLPWFPHLSLVVMELAPGIPVDALIGMDIIRTCRMLVDGPAQTFTLEF